VKLLPAFLLIFLSFPSSVLARSGCCSSHGGVCCECGSQSNGKVICNDGWTGSSCYYSEMVMCGGSSDYTAPTSIPIPTSVPTSVPTNTPKPVIPTSVPTKIPTSTPVSQIPTSTPVSPTATATPIESFVPSSTPTPTSIATTTIPPTSSPINPPQVMGASDTNQESTTDDSGGSVMGGLLLAGMGYGGYKLLKKLRKTKKLPES